MKSFLFAAGGLAMGLAIAATGVAAQDVGQAVKARQGQFQIMAINIGTLAGMARGTAEYDAEAAQAAADSLVAVSMIHQPPLWVEGSSEMDIDGTRAQANIWDDIPDFLSKWEDFGAGATAMQAAAGTGLEGVQGAIGGVGGACSACHDVYRAPAD